MSDRYLSGGYAGPNSPEQSNLATNLATVTYAQRPLAEFKVRGRRWGFDPSWKTLTITVLPHGKHRLQWTGANGKTYSHITRYGEAWCLGHPDRELLRMKVELSLC